MFNNKFLKHDPLLEAVKAAQADGAMRRQAEALVNEEFGVYSRNAVIRENLAAYDARLEEAYKCMKEGGVTTDAFGTKMTNAGHPNVYHDSESTSYKASADRMKSGEKAYNPHGTDIKEAKKADKDYDKDGKVESPKDEVWGSRLRAAKLAGKLEEGNRENKEKKKEHEEKTGFEHMKKVGAFPGQSPKRTGRALAKEETQIDEISRTTLKSYVKKADRQAANLERKVDRRTDRPGEEEKMYKRIEGSNLARRKMGVRVAATEETDYSAQDRAPVTKSAPKEDPSLPKSYPGAASSAPTAQRLSNAKAAVTPIKEAKYSAKAARAGADIGKPGKNFEKIAKKAGEKYGSEEKGKKVAGAILAKIRAKHMKEDSSFNSAQVTGKSVEEAAVDMYSPPAIERPANTTKAPQAQRTSVRAPTFSQGASQAGVNVKPTVNVSGKFGMQQGMSQAGREASKMVKPTVPIDRIAYQAAQKGASILPKVAKIAGGPVVAGAITAMTPSPANKGENEFARQAARPKTPSKELNPATTGTPGKMEPYNSRVGPSAGKFSTGTAAPAAAPKAAPTPVKQSFSQAYRSAREAGGSTAQFEYGGKKFQAAATKKEYVPTSQQKPVDTTPAKAPEPQTQSPGPETQALGSKADHTRDIEAKKNEPKKDPVIRNMQESVQVGDNKYRIV